MKTVTTLNELVMSTAHAREQYRLHGTYFWRAMYESKYVELGQLAYDQRRMVLKSPAALQAMYRLAIDTE
ncbi:hypothetical protein [Dickeya dadantii]|uniref:hypothetical protein n=1 Tax=Dickeya dadantii TaxID=204038 RepID=UPI001CC42017|nr:hypothetical protein [Dickeya dadantii]UAY97124.1 hypothetical protein KTF62_04290 [Dickeya dadantii]